MSKRLFKNFFSLGLLQVANYAFPLLTVPYLVRTLGVESYGVLGFATALVTYFSLLTDYGFNISATRKVAANKSCQTLLNEVFSTVVVIKLLLLVLSICLLLLLTTWVPRFLPYQELYFLTFGVVIGQTLFPLWLYLGMEEMLYIPMINVFSKTLFTISIFVFIQSEQDLLLVPLLASCEAIFAGGIALLLAYNKFHLRFEMPSIKCVSSHVADGWYVFVSSLSINVYKTNAVLVLGIFSTDLIVGYFVIAKKLYEAANGVNSIIHQVFLPYVTQAQAGKNHISKSLKLLFKVCVLSSITLFAIVFLAANNVIELVAGEVINEASVALKFFSLSLFLIGMNIPAAIYLLQGKNDKLFSKAVLFGALFDLSLLLVLVPTYGIYGALITVTCTEAVITILLYFYANKVYKRE